MQLLNEHHQQNNVDVIYTVFFFFHACIVFELINKFTP
jgi:hypothetical protein